MTSPDYKGDIDRIIEILKHAANGLFPAVSIGDGKLRKILFGEDSHKINDDSFPYALVTTPTRPFATQDRFGIGDGSADPQISVQYVIKVFAKEGRPQKAEELLYGFINKIVTILKANPRLKEPVGLTDPKCIRSFILDVVPIPDKRGQEIQGAEIVIQCQIGTGFTIDIAGFSGVSLVSKPVERETEITENIYDTARVRKTVSPIAETHVFFAEIEYMESIVSALRTQKRNRTIISTTLTRPSGATVYSGKIVEISNGAGFDQLETATIQFEVIH